MKMYKIRNEHGQLICIKAQKIPHDFANLIVHHELERTKKKDSQGIEYTDYTATGNRFTVSDISTGTAIFTQLKKKDAIKCAFDALDKCGEAQYKAMVEYNIGAMGQAN